MTVAAAAAKAGPYTGNDSASSFAFSFKVFADADIHVVKTVIASGAESDLVLNTDYTVTRNVDQDTNPGGSVVYKVGGVTTALPSTLKLTIVGDFDYAQPTDIPNGGSFFASVIETAFDRVTMLIKQLKERVDNALTLPVSVSGVSAELPTPEAMAVIGWNTDGDALVNYDAASLAGAVAAVDWIVDTFDGDGVETAFVLARDPGVAANCDISISGVTQVPGVDFTVSSTSLTFTTAPASGTDNICVRYGSALPSAASVPVNGVATASIQDSAVTTDKIAADAVTVAKIADAELKALAGLTSAANKVPRFTGSGTADLLDFKDEDDMASDSATAVPSQQSVKAYVDAEVAAAAGTVVQVVEATPYATYSNTAVNIPNDDTIPQSGEGAEWNTVAITPTNASNRLVIEALFDFVSGTSSSDLIAALFQDAGANAIAVTSTLGANGGGGQLALRHEMAAGGTSATTFKLRAGAGTSGTLYVNGTSGGRRLGGISAVRLRVTEIKV